MDIDVNIIISVACFIIGLLAFLGVRITFRKKISWKEIEKAFKIVEPEIRRMAPDVIVGLSDGVVIGAIIATNLRIPLFYTIDISLTYDKNGVRIVNLQENIGDLTGKKVLVVDNHLYTGTNMKAAVEFLKRKKPKEIKTLVFFKHEVEGAAYKPDIYAYSISIKEGKRKKVPWSYTQEHEAAYYT